MPRPGMKQEKSKDFKGSMIRLYKSLGKWKSLLIISIFLAIISSILSTIAPNKLADVTDVISDGIKPNTLEFKKVSEAIVKNGLFSYQANQMIENADVGTAFYQNEEQLSHLKESFMKLSDAEKEKYFAPIEIDGVKISAKDQVKFMNTMATIDSSMVTEDYLLKLEEMPKSIQSLVEPKLNMDQLKYRSLVLAIIYLFSSLFIYVQDIILAYMSTGYSKGLRSDISKKINRLPLRYFDNHETGDVLSRITNDVDSIGFNINQSISSLVSNVTLFLGSIVMMFVTNWIMASSAIFSSILGFVLSFLLLKVSQKYFVRRQEELGELNGHIEEVYSGHNVVKTYNGEEDAIKEFDSINERLYDSNRKSQFLSGIMHPIMAFIGNLDYVVVCVVGALLVMNGKTSFGVIVAFMIYVRLFTRPLSQIAQSFTALQSTAAAAERVFEFMDEVELTSEENIHGHISKKDAIGNIEFKNVKFGYDEGKDVIKKFSASVSSGQKIAIVGPTGAGKTTMVNLLMKFYEIHEGDILIDGVSIRDLTRENIHELFCMVLQDTWLFDGTIRDNIIYNQGDISDETVWNACKIVGIDHFIRTLPGALDAKVGDNDAISSGQKQLITIARGMIEDAPFLILDEATSNVDTRTG